MEQANEQKPIGCGWQAAIALGTLVSVFVLLGFRTSPQLPSGLGVAEVLEASSDGFFMEACAYAAYRLEPATVERIRTSGVGFLNNLGLPSGSSQSYERWAPTPAAKGTERALAATGCSNSDRSGVLNVKSVLSRPGSYYSASENGEGLMVVDPRRSLGWFLYFG